MRQVKPTSEISPVPYSPNLRAWLLFFAACQPRAPMPDDLVNWSQLLQELNFHRLIGLADFCLRFNVENKLPPINFRKSIRLVHYKNTVRMANIDKQTKSVIHVLNKSDVDYLVLKGPALSHLIYPEPTLRVFGDLDLMICEKDREEIDQLLKSQGYSVQKGYDLPLPKVTIKDVPYHNTKYHHAKTGFTVEIHYEDLLCEGLVSNEIEKYWSRAIQIMIQGYCVKTLSLNDQFVLMCAHAHRHGYTPLFWLSDLVLMLRDHKSNLDWEIILKTVNSEEAQVSIYYTLLLITRLFDLQPPDGILNTVKPNSFRCWWHDRYMPQELMMNLSIKKWIPFSFKSRPFFSSAFLNILVMGRRKEKLQYLIRWIFPRKDWIINKYQVYSLRDIIRSYFIHFFKHIYRTILEILFFINPKSE